MLHATLNKILLRFITPGRTSRGILNDKPSWILVLENRETGKKGFGECSVIPGLNPEFDNTYEETLLGLIWKINSQKPPPLSDYNPYPSIRFGYETALRDLETGGKRLLFPSSFTEGNEGIPINGLIWMGSIKEIELQVREKLNSGFKCLKLKIGALDFRTEVDLLKKLRKEYNPGDLEIRLDANGAFLPEEALEKLKILSGFHIHSVEQPIGTNQWNEMAGICEHSPVPVALDEELTGADVNISGEKMLAKIRPQYIILKPGMLGGFENSMKWISLAEKAKTGWWITSALESNIGLNAIAQWTCTLNSNMIQGLGTGKVFENNIPSPLSISGQFLYYDPSVQWDLKSVSL